MALLLPIKLVRKLRAKKKNEGPRVEMAKQGFKLYASAPYQDTLMKREKLALDTAIATQEEDEAGKLDNLVHSLHERMKDIGTEVSERLEVPSRFEVQTRTAAV